MASVNFVVRFTSGKAVEVKLPAQATVKHIKDYLFEFETHGTKGTALGKLFLEGKELSDDATLAAAGVAKECILSYIEAAEGDSIALSTTCEVTAVDFSAKREDFLVMISMKAPLLADVKRVPIDLVLVIDRSGSMGSLMELVIEMAEFVVRQLLPSDRLAIVEYDNEITTLLPLKKMSVEGKAEATAKAKTLQARGGTNLAGGLYRGLQVALERNPSEANEVASVLLFTDGQANEGDTNKSIIVQHMLDTEFIRSFNPAVRSFNPAVRVRGGSRAMPVQQQQPQQQQQQTQRLSVGSGPKGGGLNGCTLNTFGFGTNHNADLLKGIAEAGTGLYFYIENSDSIGDAFVECVGGLLSVVGQNLKVLLEPAQGIVVSDILTQYPHKAVGGGCFEVLIKDIQSEESRDLLCQVVLPKLEKPIPKEELVRFTLTYDNLVRKQQERLTVFATVDRPPSDHPSLKEIQVDVKLDKQRNRTVAAQALAHASRLGDLGDVVAARKLVGEAIERIGRSVTGKDEYCLGLVENLKQCLAGLRDQSSYDQVGSKMCMSSASAHYQQRSNMQAPVYSNVKKAAMKSSYANFKSK